MRPTLLILAAGMASRYGSMKQMEGFGPSGETIMDYSIYDAIRSGFGKIVFIIRENYAEDFRQVFEPRWGNKIKLEYVYQELDSHINGFQVPEGRTKPWGTAHAVLCAVEAIREPFAVINADDFYGSDSFKQASRFLTNECSDKLYSIIGYELLKTLSENGTVNRGVCQLDKNGNLSSVTERLNIAMKNGTVVCDDEHEPKELPMDTSVSMNFWCFHPSLFEFSEKIFLEFLADNISKPKAEFFIPIVADRFIREGGTIRVIPTTAQWFGVTYKEDAPEVRGGLNKLVKAGEYPGTL